MFKKFQITTALFLTIAACVVGAVALLGFMESRLQARRFIAMKEDSGHLTSDVILHGLTSYMQDRDLEKIQDVVKLMISRQSGIRRVRLINKDGEIVVSSNEAEEGRILKKTAGGCRNCHAGKKPAESVSRHSLTMITGGGGEEKLLTVVTPVYNNRSCATDECHYHPAKQKVLGMIETDYSLSDLDSQLAELRGKTSAAAAAAALIIIPIIWLFITRFVSMPVRGLLAGMRRVAAGELSYRYPVRVENEIGHIGAVFNVMVDELQSKTGELRSARDHLRSIIEGSGDIITTADLDGRLTSINAAGERILGYSRGELIGQNAEVLFDNPVHRHEAANRIAGGEQSVSIEAVFRRKDGESVEVILTMSPLIAPDGKPRGMICISADITEFKEMQRKLVQSERLAAIGTALASISHNAKNILNNLRGGSYMMRLGFSKEKLELLREGWSVVEMGISKLSSMAMDMLNFTREKRYDFKPDSLNDIVGEICDLLTLSSGKTDVEITWDLDPGLPPVTLDKDVIHTAILNIAGNAVDSCGYKEYPEGESPRVNVATRYERRDDYAVIEISDNGIGIPKEHKTKLFKPFFTTKFDRGTGLGLAITIKAIEGHNGFIDVESETGKGAVFTIKLPVAQGRRDNGTKENASDK